MEALQETTTLISSEKVAGTAVYNTGGEEIGSIHDVMLDKKSGSVAYAVMAFGGFLGIGSKRHPLPWSLLKYDTSKGGYVVNLDRSQLEGAPTYDDEVEPIWDDKCDDTVYDHYGVKPYWPYTLP